LDDQGKFVHSNYVIPFTVGPRRCLGEQLALMEIFVFLAGMVQKFEFLPEDEKNVPVIDELINTLILPPYPFKVVAKEI